MIGCWLIAPKGPKDLKALKAQLANPYNLVLVSIAEVLLTSTKALEITQKMSKLKGKLRQNRSGKL